MRHGDAGEPLLTGARPSLLAFNGDGDELAAVTGAAVVIYESERGVERRRVEFDQPLRSLDWHGTKLAAGLEDGRVVVHDETDGSRVTMAAHLGLVRWLKFDPTGELLVSSSYSGVAKFWETATGQLLFTSDEGAPQQFNPSGNRLALTHYNGGAVWRLERPRGYRVIQPLGQAAPGATHVDFSPDGRWLAMTDDLVIDLADTASGRVVTRQTFKRRARSAHFLSDGTNLLVSADNGLWRWPLLPTTNALAFGKPARLGTGPMDSPDIASLTPDRRFAAVPVDTRTVVCYDLARDEVTARVSGLFRPITTVISPDRQWIATGSFHGSTTMGTGVWELPGGRNLRQLARGNAIPFLSPDGRVLIVAGTVEYEFFDTQTWARTHVLATDRRNDLFGRAAFSPDGRWLALVRQHSTVQLLDTRDWSELAVLTSPMPQQVAWLTFSPDNRRLAVAGAGGRVELWDIAELRAGLRELGLDWADAGK